MLFDKNIYYKLSEEIRKRIVKCYIIYIILFTIIGLIISNIIPILKENSIITIITIIIFMCIGLLIADEKTETIQIQEQEMKWKLDIYDMINKIEKK